MASFSDQVKVLIDVDSTGATSGITNFKNSFKEAEGAVGKFKVASGAAFDFMKANLATFAAAAGAAIGAFALKAISQFQDLALEVDKFRNATGLSLDASSRWIEVAGDLGVSSDTVRNAINKMNREIAGNRDEFEKLGIEIARTDDGATDVNQTFLNVIDRLQKISDPAKRAQAATQLLGKSWQEVSEIITMGANNVASALNQVGGAKIIDQAEIDKAKALRDVQDRLRDTFEEFTITIGEKLVPGLIQAVEAALPLIKALGFVGGAALDGADASASLGEQMSKNNIQMRLATNLGKIFSEILGFTSDKTEQTSATTEILNERWARGVIAMGRARHMGAQLAQTISALDQDTNGLIDTWDEFLGQLDSERAWNNLEEMIRDYNESVLTAFKKNTPEAWAAADEARREASEGVADYIRQVGDIPAQKQTEILAAVKMGDFEAAKKIIATIPKQVVVEIVGKVRGVPIPRGQTPSETFGGGTRFATADGILGEQMVIDTTSQAINSLDQDTNYLIDTWDTLLEQLDTKDAWDNVGDQIGEYRRDLTDAFKKRTPEAARAAVDSSRDVIRAFADVAQQAKLTNDQQIALKALLDKGDFDKAYASLNTMINGIPKEVVIKVKQDTSGFPLAAGQLPSDVIKTPFGMFRPKLGGGFEFYNPPALNNNLGSAIAPTSVVVNVTGSVVTENELVESIRKGLVDAQRNGKQLVVTMP